MNNKKERLIVALDVKDFTEAEKLVDLLLPVVRIFKVGSQVFTSSGPEIVKAIHRRRAKVFLDLKFCDIPNTVGQAVRSAADLGVFMLTVHTLGSRQMIREAVRSLSVIADGQRPLLVGVTILTSLDRDALREIGIERPLTEEVMTLAVMAKEEGLDGIICSPEELSFVRKWFKKDFLIITPGIRLGKGDWHDQKRVMGPQEAIRKGANYIVVGRPIVQSPDPLEAAKAILTEMETGC